MIVKIADIKIGERKRKLDNSKVEELAESIKTLGLLSPITINSDNELISGWHRIEAYKLLSNDKIEVIKKDFDTIKKELAQLDENLIRRELSALEIGEFLLRRDELLNALGLRAKAGDNQHTLKNAVAGASPKTTKEISKEIDISERAAQKKKQIARDLAEAAKDKIRNTPLSNNVSAMLEISKLPSKQQAKLAGKLSGMEDRAKIDRKINEVIREENVRKAHKKAGEFKGIKGFEFYTGDFNKICSGMPDSSIDCIITDPPYPPQYLDLWKQLGAQAFRLLKPSGFLVAYTGKNHLPTVINHLLNAGLEYYWVATIAYLGNHRVPTIAKNVYESTRPVLIFQKPPFKAVQNAFVDLIRCDEEKEKKLHAWQQNLEPFRYFIQRFTKRNDLILEPFLGAGTVAEAALREERRCIGIDIKEENIKIAKGRIQEYLEKGKQKKAA